jgi:hypothetical protein
MKKSDAQVGRVNNFHTLQTIRKRNSKILGKPLSLNYKIVE